MQIGPKHDIKNLKLSVGPITGLLNRMTPTCEDMTHLLSEGMDRPLPLPTRIKMRLHFLICKWCKRYKTQLLFLRNAIRRHPEKLEGHDSPSSATLSPEARERLTRILNDRRQ